MSLSERAVRSIHDVHDLIHAVFTRPAAQTEALRSELMAVFADNFSMVTTAGAIVDRQQVGQLFERAAGARPGLGPLRSPSRGKPAPTGFLPA